MGEGGSGKKQNVPFVPVLYGITFPQTSCLFDPFLHISCKEVKHHDPCLYCYRAYGEWKPSAYLHQQC